MKYLGPIMAAVLFIVVSLSIGYASETDINDSLCDILFHSCGIVSRQK